MSLLRKIGVLIGLGAVIGLLVLIGVPRDRDLISISTRVPGFSISANRICMGSGWTSNHYVTWLEYGVGSRSQDLISLNTSSGEIDIRSTMARLFIAAGTPNLGPRHLSPDGQWVFEGSPLPNHYVLREVQGSRHGRYHLFGGVLMWRADGREWLEYRSGSNSAITVFSVDGSPPRTYPISLRVNEYVIWFDSSGRVVTNNSNRHRNTLDLREISLGRPRSDRRFQLQLPRNRLFIDTIMSPTAERVLCHLASGWEQPSWLEWQLMRLGFGKPKPNLDPSHVQDVLYVSRPDGTDFRELGRVDAEQREADWLRLAAWNPGGKSVTFTYRRKLFAKSVH